MEKRSLLSAVLVADGTLTVTGTGGADNITVDVQVGPGETTNVTVNGVGSSFVGVKREVINALGGNDTVTIASSDGDAIASVFGGAGNDTLHAGNSNDFANDEYYLDGGDGNDHLDLVNNGDNTVHGGNGDDVFTCNTFSTLYATMLGEAGNDTFVDEPDCTITASGGPGTDFVDCTTNGLFRDSIISLNGTQPPSSNPVVHRFNGQPDIENLEANGGVGGSYLIVGNDLPNRIECVTSQPVQITGGGGNDTIVAGGGPLTIDGGAGNDLIDASQNTSGARLSGGDGNDILLGGSAADKLFGGNGNDRLVGNAGNDTMDGGAGSDTMIGGAGTDVVDYTKRSANLTVWLDGSHASGQAGENDHFDGTTEIVWGGSGNDYLVGTKGNNALYGNGGNDTIYGGGGVDAFFGGGGNDIIHAKNGNKDYVDGGPGNDTAYTDPIDTVLNVEHRF